MPILRHHGVLPVVHPTAFVAEGGWIIGEVSLGESSGVWFNAVLRGDINAISVGARSNVQDGCVVHVTRLLPVRIGDDVTVGHMAMLHGCVIEDRTLIGMNAVILDGARVGPRAIVAAGAVVREGAVIPEGVLVAGVPAKVVRPLTDDELLFLPVSAKNYVEYARSYMSNAARGTV